MNLQIAYFKALHFNYYLIVLILKNYILLFIRLSYHLVWSISILSIDLIDKFILSIEITFTY